MHYHSHHENGCHRYWWHARRTRFQQRKPERTVYLEWALGFRGPRFAVIFGGGENRTVQVAVSLVFISIWFELQGFINWDFESGMYDGRETSVAFQNWHLRIDIWAKEFEWSKRWREVGIQWSWDMSRSFLGRWKYKENILETAQRNVHMPEGAYPIRIELHEDVRHRAHFPFIKRSKRRAHVDCLTPIPKPGKGESSWNCGEDALHGSTFPARTLEEATAGIFESVMRDRTRYGSGERWRPAAMEAKA